MTIQDWIRDNLIDATIEDNIITIKDVGNFLFVEDKFFIVEKKDKKISEVVKSFYLTYDGDKFERIFDDQFHLILSPEEIELVQDEKLDIKYFVFKFGDRFYYCDDNESPVLNEFKFIGTARKELEFKFPYLGIHGAYDLCNGSRQYKDWCSKAKFLGITTLGIAEDNTLAGTLDFQIACKDAGIKSVIGETVTVKCEKTRYTLKLYAKNTIGWKNLLLINTAINVKNDGYIDEKELLDYTEGVICVLCPDAIQYFPYMEFYNCFDQLYFQFDLSEWDSNERDKKWLEWIKYYLDNWYQNSDPIPPVLIYDSYYLDKADAHIRKLLNKIGRIKFKNNSKHQWFKSLDEVFMELSELFQDNDERMFTILEAGVENLNKLVDSIDFKIEIGKLKLPKYKMTEEEKSLYNGDSLDMIVDLIGKGFEKKISGKVADEDLYWERINKELEVIKKGEVVDYFLILWDIINFCNKQDIWVGIGRGSAAGCLISYLLDIVKIDPIKYDLIFERFLNEGRVGKSLPDIDTDFEGERRDEVKRYIEQKYGVDYVTSIGTYGTMKIRAAIGDLARHSGVPNSTTKFVTKIISEKLNYTELFKEATEAKDVKSFIQKYPNVIENIPLCFNQPKTSSVHAAGVVIVPDEYGTIFQQMPVKKMDGLLVSEWEGEFIDKAGFLKCDILGIKQLDKFAAISRLIEKTENKKVTFDDIPLDDAKVYDLFKEGYNEDVFQFGTEGLKAYCRKLKPDNIEDLIAAVSLYRPGAMDTGGHEKYIKVKQGVESPIYWYGCKEITENTYGQIVYQEQVMSIVQKLGGFTLVEADDIRKAMGKKDQELLDSFKGKFIDGAIVNGCPPDEADGLWQALETFGRYGFNRSHAACYAITGYYSQWFKLHYPLQFWTVSLQFADDKDILSRIAEIGKIASINIAPPHINKSANEFMMDKTTNSIYWSINSISYVGASCINDLKDEKTLNGDFYSFEEFVERTEKYRSVNKRCIKHLILSGAFDEIENITNIADRIRLLKYYYDFRKIKFDEDIQDCHKWKYHKWIMVQRDLSGSGYIDFEKLILGTSLAAYQGNYKTVAAILHDELPNDTPAILVAVCNKMEEKNSKNGVYARIKLQDDTETIIITCWSEIYDKYKDLLKDAEGRLMIISGRVNYDTFFEKKTFFTNGKTKIELL